uniref:hypothetical protein n=1 Tax=Aminicella lysinilytica TaxID=433323 RepID=UPI002ED67CDE
PSRFVPPLPWATICFADTSNVAKIGTTEYTSVQAAVDAVTTTAQTTITLEKDSTEAGVIVPENKNITIDLNGHNITGLEGAAANPYDNEPTIKNAGTLTIDGSGTVSSARTYDAAVYNTNTGTATLNGGTYEAANWYSLRNEGNMIINSGVTASTDNSQSTTTVINGVTRHGGTSTVTAHMTINGGTFTGYYNVIKNGDNYAVLTINGGEFTVPAGSSWDNHVLNNCNNCVAKINGGTFINKTSTDNAVANVLAKHETAAKDFVVTGGTFSADPSTYVASGYVVSKSGSNYAVSAYIPPKTNTDTTTTPTGTVKTTTTTTPDITTTATGQVTATVSDTEASNILNSVKNAEAAGGDVATNVIIAGAGETGADQIHVSMPANMVSALATETKATVTVTTAVASVTMDQKALDAVASVAGGAGQVTLEVSNIAKSTLPATLQKELGDAVKILDVKLATPNGNVTNFNGGTVTINTQIPAAIPADDAACLYLDDDNNAFAVPGKVVKGANGEENYEFTTHHNSHYAIVTKENAEKAIAATTASQNAKAKKAVKATKVKLSKKASAKKAKLNWMANGTVSLTTYRVYRSVKKASGYKCIKTVKSTHYTFKKNPKKHYYYKVRAYKKIAGVNVYTNYSNILRI